MWEFMGETEMIILELLHCHFGNDNWIVKLITRVD